MSRRLGWNGSVQAGHTCPASIPSYGGVIGFLIYVGDLTAQMLHGN